MDDEKPDRPCASPADKRGSAAEQTGAPDDVSTAPSLTEVPEAQSAEGFEWPAPGISLRFGLQTVTGMAVHEGPPFYRLS